MTKWSDDAFLNTLRQHGDEPADTCVECLRDEEFSHSDFAKLFAWVTVNDAPLPPTAPASLQEFFDGKAVLPPDVDLERISAGERVFAKYACPAALVLLAKSLPEGYAAPNLSLILHLSGDLDFHPYRRLLGVLQMLVLVCALRGFGRREQGDEHDGMAIVTALKLRLLHAGIRRLVPRNLPEYQQQYGAPINLEDMLATLMGFSYLVIDGLQKLEIDLQEQEQEDFYYVWQTFARVMGIHPPDSPESLEYVPSNVTEAAEFYASYARRHYVDAPQNPRGVALAKANLKMLQDFVPLVARILGGKIMPRIYMQDLIGADGCRRVGIRPVRGHALLKFLFLRLPRFFLGVQRVVHDVEGSRYHLNWASALFQELINTSYGGEVTFILPDRLADLRKLA